MHLREVIAERCTPEGLAVLVVDHQWFGGRRGGAAVVQSSTVPRRALKVGCDQRGELVGASIWVQCPHRLKTVQVYVGQEVSMVTTAKGTTLSLPPVDRQGRCGDGAYLLGGDGQLRIPCVWDRRANICGRPRRRRRRRWPRTGSSSSSVISSGSPRRSSSRAGAWPLAGS